MYTDKGKAKPKTTIEDVEVALDKLILALEKGDSLQWEEEDVHKTVVAYVRYRSRLKFPFNDKQRTKDTSSEISGTILQRIFVTKYWPSFMLKLKNNPTEETKAECLKWLNYTVNKNCRHIPVEWARKKIDKIINVAPHSEIICCGEEFSTPEQEFINNETTNCVQNLLNSLPEEESELIRLRLFEELTFDQLSERFGVASSTLTKRYARLRKKLQKKLSDDNIKL